MEPIFQFSNVVVVDESQIGVIVKSWGPGSLTQKYQYDVYVRSLNTILTYNQDDIKHFIYSKELSEDELEFY